MISVIYVAINKETGEVMSGQKGQYAFPNKERLKKSVNYHYRYVANRNGVDVNNMYDIYELDITKALSLGVLNEVEK